MKKVEAQELAIEKSRFIIECITQILSDSVKVQGKMRFTSRKIENQNMCVLDFCVPQKNVDVHYNLGITSDHFLVLYDRLLNDLLDTFLEHESIGVTKYYSIKYFGGENFSGINAVNAIGSEIKIDFGAGGKEFMDLIALYTKRYDEFVNCKSESTFKKSR